MLIKKKRVVTCDDFVRDQSISIHGCLDHLPSYIVHGPLPFISKLFMSSLRSLFRKAFGPV